MILLELLGVSPVLHQLVVPIHIPHYIHPREGLHVNTIFTSVILVQKTETCDVFISFVNSKNIGILDIPTFFITPASIWAVNEVISLGLQTTVFPAASAGAILNVNK